MTVGNLVVASVKLPRWVSRRARGGFLAGGFVFESAKGLRLSRYFGDRAKFWLGLQDDFDIEEENRTKEKDFSGIKPVKLDAA